MRIEELRDMMDTDARRRAQAQAKTIRELHEKIAALRAENERLRARIDNPPGFDQERG
jgi:uncharacterized small protein (DUF1192 family)